MANISITLTTPKTLSLTKVEVLSSRPDLTNQQLVCNCQVFDSNNNPVKTFTVKVPFSAIDAQAGTLVVKTTAAISAAVNALGSF